MHSGLARMAPSRLQTFRTSAGCGVTSPFAQQPHCARQVTKTRSMQSLSAGSDFGRLLRKRGPLSHFSRGLVSPPRLGCRFNSLRGIPHRTSISTKRLFCRAAEVSEFPAEDLPKNFDPASREQVLYQWWESNEMFKPDPEATGEPFTLSMPPPNVTGKLHMGHAMFVTLEDIMVRYARMTGRPTLWVPGTDHAGIATQLVVERMLTAEGISRKELGREKFLEKVWEWKAEYGGMITEQIRRL
ncbi:hypothetical protein CYMTET_16438, partial [Cymbomonas tetramitiformis]